MPAAATLVWFLLTLALVACGRLAASRAHYRWSVVVCLGITLIICFTLVWTSNPAALFRWSAGLSFDSLGMLLLPPLWCSLAAIMLFAALTEVPRAFLPLAGLLGTISTAGIVSASALFLIAMLQAGTRIILLGVSIGIGARPRDGLLRVATTLKYVTLSVVSAACLVVGLLLQSFYALNPDRQELPAIVTSLLVVGFGLSVAAMPFYFHLPDLLDAAPPVVSALLIGPVQTLAFVYLVRTVGNGPWLLDSPHIVAVLSYGGLGGALLAGIMAASQPTLNRFLAFSAIQEAGWIAFGVGSATTAGWRGALAFLAVRVVVKPVLLMAMGQLQRPAGGRATGLAGVAWDPAALLAWCVGGLALLGLPLTAGFWGMRLLFEAALHLGPAAVLLLALSLLSGLAAWLRLTRDAVWPKGAKQPAVHLSSSLLGLAGAGVVLVGVVPALLTSALAPVAASLPFLH
ncbi:MAG: proton-conducting transporter membrane subunit [Chloroflexota bacterium]